MQVHLKNGSLVVVLGKREQRCLLEAANICQTISGLSPINPDLVESANGANVDINFVLKHTQTEVKQAMLPIMEEVGP
jgi:hypothetical protein